MRLCINLCRAGSICGRVFNCEGPAQGCGSSIAKVVWRRPTRMRREGPYGLNTRINAGAKLSIKEPCLRAKLLYLASLFGASTPINTQLMHNYLAINKDHWNKSTLTHWTSDFYRVQDWLAGTYDSLKAPELALLPANFEGQKLLHLQCHFGQDTLSLARRGAQVTGVDLSDAAIEKARELNALAQLNGRFFCCDLYSFPDRLPQEKASFDWVFSSYGTIGWLPDINRWAAVVADFLRPGGTFVFAEFHPFIWMLNHERNAFPYSYFQGEAIVEESTVSYTDGNKASSTEVGWNHSLASVISALLRQGLELKAFEEYDYSPWACFHDLVELAPDEYHFKGMEGKLPLTYSLAMVKK